MIDYTSLYAQMSVTPLAGWLGELPAQVSVALAEGQHGRLNPQSRPLTDPTSNRSATQYQCAGQTGRKGLYARGGVGGVGSPFGQTGLGTTRQIAPR